MFGGLLDDPDARNFALAGLLGQIGSAFAPTTDPGARQRALAQMPMAAMQGGMMGRAMGQQREEAQQRRAWNDYVQTRPEAERPMYAALGPQRGAMAMMQERQQQRQLEEARAFMGGGMGGSQPQAAPNPVADMDGALNNVPENFREIFRRASMATGVPVPVLAAVARQESSFNPNARGRAGEVGMFQIMPSTAQNPGFGLDPADPNALSDPEQNILFGARYLAARARALGVQDWNNPEQRARALAAYNGGGDPNYVRNVSQYLPQETPAGNTGGMTTPTANQIAMAAASGNPILRQWATTMAPFVRQEARADGPPTVYGTPQWGQDAQGNPVMMFPNSRGELVQPPLPPGVQLTPPTQRINTGTEEVIINSRTGDAVARIPINTRAREAEQALGRSQGEQAAAAPAAIQQGEDALRLLTELRNHRALSAGTGLTGPILSALPGTPMYDFRQRVAQIQGQNFLQAFESLRGGGQITEVEGRKATEAISRLNQGLSERDFLAAVKDIEDVVRKGIERARANQGRANDRLPGAPDATGAPVGNTGMTASPPAPAAAGGWSIQRVR